MKSGPYIDRRARRPRWTPYQRQRLAIMGACFIVAAGLLAWAAGADLWEKLS